AVQLLVELTWWHVLIAKPMRYGTKRSLIDDVAAIGGAVGPTGLFDEALHRGLVSTGTSFYTRRPNQLWLLVRFAERWTTASDSDRATWLADPWRFRELVFSLEGLADQTQRHALIHLVHPDTFEDCVSQYSKRDIARLATDDERDENVDRTIESIRA